MSVLQVHDARLADFVQPRTLRDSLRTQSRRMAGLLTVYVGGTIRGSECNNGAEYGP